MRSQTTAEFRDLFAGAPSAIQAKAQSAYRLWSDNPSHPSLRFKKVASHPEYLNTLAINLPKTAREKVARMFLTQFPIGAESLQKPIGLARAFL